MQLTLKVWRQNSTDDAGRFETYTANDITEHMSFLEMTVAKASVGIAGS